ncbi:DUF5107 domain-containing protein, partial [Actinotalea sp.]|uniref:DUF5107 domain-containing protein n=1 Tax=Actinotalea sp. TaxID=1872145 RepID=UPI003565371E
MSADRNERTRLVLPDRPEALAARAVAAWQEPVEMPTYEPATPDRYPAYFDRRVYQGSSGRVYPLPFHDRIGAEPSLRSWGAVHLENRWLRVMLLPELGGRIHVAVDRTTGYDLFYRNDVIKPALIGLAGPWISGGVELNWPQHHRPGTYLPTDVSIEEEEDGSVTVWCSDHDPLTRMKGMHGVRLSPDRATLELRVRLYNRSEITQTFLWWANVAVRTHEDYQSFFPSDVHQVADHARRATTSFPASDGYYYGIDYSTRAEQLTDACDGTPVPGDRLDWYRNIPVPTSYMCVGSDADFFGGYDHAARAGMVHVADRRVAVGKKQFTWGDGAFGHAWERNLTDDGSHYLELMAGVFTDNQPDFSWLAPGETKVFSQFWYPIQEIGPAVAANLDAAVALTVRAASDGTGAAVSARVGVVVTRETGPVAVEVVDPTGRVLAESSVDVAPGSPAVVDLRLVDGADPATVGVRLRLDGAELLSWTPPTATAPPMEPATEPPAPTEVASVEELYLTGLHIAQYRHPTRSPLPYWTEALRRDPGHAPTCTALAALAYTEGRYADAEGHARTALARLTRRNANPADSGAHYLLGLALRRQGRAAEAYDAFGKASWVRGWRGCAGYQMAVLDVAAGRDGDALHRLEDVLRTEPEHLQARALRVIVLRRLGRSAEAEALLQDTLALDPLDWWSRDLRGDELSCDAQTCLDLALEYASCGLPDVALGVLGGAAEQEAHRVAGAPATGPLLGYHVAALHERRGDSAAAAAALEAARVADPSWCFPVRLDDADALGQQPTDGRAAGLLGHWLYAHDRPADAIAAWQRAVAAVPEDVVSWRNLGLAAINRTGDPRRAREAYDAALRVAPDDPQLVVESDQLALLTGEAPAARRAYLEGHAHLLADRDGAAVELAHLSLDLGDADAAHAVLSTRVFGAAEGGEGQVLEVWERSRLALARRATAAGDTARAVALVEEALDPPSTLGEARHPLTNPAHLHLARGDALALAGDRDAAEGAWRRAADAEGDFRAMNAEPFSEATYFSVLAQRRLGQVDRAERTVADLAAHIDRLREEPATIDYFATSLATRLVFNEDLDVARRRRIAFLDA